LLVFATAATANDFWLIPNAFAIAAGADVTVHEQTSSAYPTSESAVTTDRSRWRGCSARETMRRSRRCRRGRRRWFYGNDTGRNKVKM
jgi:hypothetical protein